MQALSDRAMTLVFEQQNVRVFGRQGEPWWVLADVCEVLELRNPSAVAARLDDDEKNTLTISEGIPGNPNMTVISEPGLYAVLRSSRKPVAKRFDRWVRHDVLPEIRRTGAYRGTVPSLKEIGFLFDTKLEPVHHGMAQMRGEIAEVRGNVVFLSKRIDDIVPRRNPTENTRKQGRYTLMKCYGGKCPCCFKVKIINDDGTEIKGSVNWDHFEGRERNGPEHGWPVATECHFKLTHLPGFKDSKRAAFSTFQMNRRELFGTHKHGSHRSKTRKRNFVKSERQGEFSF